MRDFSEIAKELRQSKHLTQTQLAQRMWVQKSIISAYETGMRQPSLDMLIRYAKEFHVSTDYLLGLNSRKELDISDLTDDQQLILHQLLAEFRNRTK